MKDKSPSLLSDVWREACRHIDIGQSTQTITALLGRHTPLSRALVRQVEPVRSCVDTVAVGQVANLPRDVGQVANLPAPIAQASSLPKVSRQVGNLPHGRTDCSAAEMEKVLAWCRRGRIAHRGKPGQRSVPWETILPSGVEGDVIAGPLHLRNGHFGVLVLIADASAAFDEHHAALMQVLLEPFSVALDNDHQLRELATLREAAEAEKQSLLTRLGREKLGDTIVGGDSGLRGVMDRVELVARSDVPVLIFGETGSGKELVARAIHTRSSRRAAAFIRVNCGAIPPELIDSQLFGHERGAFTGAVETRKGWFERADGGTLLLDEIGELPLAAQVRLLRILQDGWLERVGGHQPIGVDVRIVAATHRDLAAMVAEGRFREDLWYRIAVFPIVLPPLRERRDDIPELARHFATRAATRFGLYCAMPSPEDLELLKSYAWPGNVRELAAVIDRAAILGDGKRLEVAKSLGVATVPAAAELGAADRREAPPAPSAPAGIVPLDAVVRQHIEAALAATKGRIEGRYGAAALLRINPHTLRARMRKLGIDWGRFRAD
jgi:transcriptional regulator with GAF, ATPase, and Fis domain